LATETENDTTEELAEVQPITSATQARVVAALVLAGCLGVLGLAAWLEPDPRGYGTAERFGGPCGMLVTTGLPCPTCGMTTAFAYAVRGRFLAAAWAQPAGLVLALATGALAGVSLWTLGRGRWPQISVWIMPHHLFLILLVVLLGGWAYKLVMVLLDKDFPYR
jgi:hypothetical protein